VGPQKSHSKDALPSRDSRGRDWSANPPEGKEVYDARGVASEGRYEIDQTRTRKDLKGRSLRGGQIKLLRRLRGGGGGGGLGVGGECWRDVVWGWSDGLVGGWFVSFLHCISLFPSSRREVLLCGEDRPPGRDGRGLGTVQKPWLTVGKRRKA